MLNKIKNRKQEGFTIIEVLIVLAIAGLIMLIVFLAVPALQRNSRNTQRTNDASRMSAAVTECLNNNNGKVTGTCDSLTANKVPNYITIADNQQLTKAVTGVDGALLTFTTKCSADGTASVAGGGSRSFTLVYLIETATSTAPRCLGS